MSHADFLLLGYGVPALLLVAELLMLARRRRRDGTVDGGPGDAP